MSKSSGDSFYVRNLHRIKDSEDLEVRFKPILTTNDMPTIPIDDSDYYNYPYQKQAKGIRSTRHDEMMIRDNNEPSNRYAILSSIDEDLLNSSRSGPNNDSYTVDELKDFLRQLSLRVSGSKSELVERLLFEKDSLNFDVD